MAGWPRPVLVSTLIYGATVLALWLLFGVVSGLLSGKRFFDDDVGAALAVVLIPGITFAAALGFGVVHGILAFHRQDAFPVSLRAIALSILVSIIALVALNFILEAVAQLAAAAVRDWSNDHFLMMELVLAFLAGAIGFVIVIGIPGEWDR
jgi:hypothetical protein